MSGSAFRQYLEGLAPDRRRVLRATLEAERETARPSRRVEVERSLRLLDDVGDWSPGQMTFDDLSPLAYLTGYDALVCGVCAHDVTGLGPRSAAAGIRPRLTAVPIPDVLAEWPEACCEECGVLLGGAS
jgi:hypothetical protein